MRQRWSDGIEASALAFSGSEQIYSEKDRNCYCWGCIDKLYSYSNTPYSTVGQRIINIVFIALLLRLLPWIYSPNAWAVSWIKRLWRCRRRWQPGWSSRGKRAAAGVCYKHTIIWIYQADPDSLHWINFFVVLQELGEGNQNTGGKRFSTQMRAHLPPPTGLVSFCNTACVGLISFACQATCLLADVIDNVAIATPLGVWFVFLLLHYNRSVWEPRTENIVLKSWTDVLSILWVWGTDAYLTCLPSRLNFETCENLLGAISFGSYSFYETISIFIVLEITPCFNDYFIPFTACLEDWLTEARSYSRKSLHHGEGFVLDSSVYLLQIIIQASKLW